MENDLIEPSHSILIIFNINQNRNHIPIKVHKGKYLKKLYGEYMNYLRARNLIDFGFMISLTLQLLKNRPDILRRARYCRKET